MRLDNLIETVPLKGKGILSVPKPEVQIDIGAPTFMDDVVIPICDPCPVELVSRSIRAAQIWDSTAAEFGFVLQYGEDKTELTLGLRGARKAKTIKFLKKFEVGSGVNGTVHLPLGQGK